MGGRILAKGENMPLPSDTARLQVLLGWQETDRQVDLDASALLLGRDRRVLSDADFVFYNQPDSSDGAARHQGRASTETGAEERIAIDLDAARGEVDVIALTASVRVDSSKGPRSGSLPPGERSA
jgi:stress response protein SCP2